MMELIRAQKRLRALAGDNKYSIQLSFIGNEKLGEDQPVEITMFVVCIEDVATTHGATLDDAMFSMEKEMLMSKERSVI